MMVFMVYKLILIELTTDATIGTFAPVLHHVPLMDLKSERFFI